jgi:hypothetical protein
MASTSQAAPASISALGMLHTTLVASSRADTQFTGPKAVADVPLTGLSFERHPAKKAPRAGFVTTTVPRRSRAPGPQSGTL